MLLVLHLGKNAISKSSLYSISIRATTSPVVVSRNSTLEDCCDPVTAIFPGGEILVTRRTSKSSRVSVVPAWSITKFSRSRFHILTLPSQHPTKILWPLYDGQVLLPSERDDDFQNIVEPVIEQNWRRDDGHKNLGFHQVFVWMGTTTDHHNLDHCLAIAKSMPPPPMIVPLTAVSLGQAQDAWWLCQSS